jgi:hypothetical protein
MPPFLPDTLSGWLSLVVQFALAVAAAVAFVAKFIRRPLQEQAERDRGESERRFKEQGERLGALGQSITTNAARIEATDRVVERVHLTQTSLAEQFGRHDARMDRVMEMLEKHERERLAEDRSIGERLARIETRLDVYDDLKKALEPLRA